MKRNLMRVVCNPSTKQISYYFRNEKGEWTVLSGNSPLSGKYYTHTSLEERASDIVRKLDEIYNRKNKGLNILVEGSSREFECLQKAIGLLPSERDVNCKLRATKIAVVGKKNVGKTLLIEGLGNLQNQLLTATKREGYTKFANSDSHTEWYELDGIDLGIEKVEEAFAAISDLVFDDLSIVIYCISGESGRIEEIEKDFITRMKEAFPQLFIIMAVTMCYKEDIKEIVDEIEKITGHMKIVPVLAKEYKISKRDNIYGQTLNVEPFGLEELSTYVFEGKKLSHKQNVRKSAVEQNEIASRLD